MSKEPRVLCKTPTPGKQGTSIAKWKYDLIRARILKAWAVPQDETGVEFSSLPSTVEEALSKTGHEKLRSVSWYTTTVKFDLNVRGEIERLPGSKPQHLRRGQWRGYRVSSPPRPHCLADGQSAETGSSTGLFAARVGQRATIRDRIV